MIHNLVLYLRVMYFTPPTIFVTYFPSSFFSDLSEARFVAFAPFFDFSDSPNLFFNTSFIENLSISLLFFRPAKIAIFSFIPKP